MGLVYRYVVKEGTLVRQSRTPPPLREGQVRVRVRAVGVNRADLLQVKGLYPPPPGYDDVPGLEFSGVVTAVKGPLSWSVGDRVMGLVAAGAYASDVVVDARHLWPIPPPLTDEEAAAVPEALATAYLNLVWQGKMRPGEWVLVHSAAGGVGTTAVQLVRLLGAYALAMVGSKEKARVVRRLGAAVALDRSEEKQKLQARLRSAAPEGVNLVLDTVGAGWEAFHVEALARQGRWLLIGLLGRTTERTLVPWDAFLRKEIMLKATLLRNKSDAFKAALMQAIADAALPAYREGLMRPVVDAVLPVDRWADAFEKIKRGDVIGKIVLRLG